MVEIFLGGGQVYVSYFNTNMLQGTFFIITHPSLMRKSQMSTPKGGEDDDLAVHGEQPTSLLQLSLPKICYVKTNNADKISVSFVHKQHLRALLSYLILKFYQVLIESPVYRYQTFSQGYLIITK